MNWEKLQEKYGKKKKYKQLLNAAIREEIAGGEELIEVLSHVAMLRRGGRFNQNAQDALEGIEDRIQNVRDKMVEEIALRYD